MLVKVVISVLCVRILQKPELASEIDSEALGKLLPAELLKPLEEQYPSKQQVNPAVATCLLLASLDFSCV